MSKKIAAYCRTSTDDKQQKPELQAAAIHSFCAGKAWGAPELYVDHGFSGGKSADQRPSLKRLMEDVRRGAVEIVVVAKLDRLARSLSHLLGLLEEFKSHGVTFVSVGDNIDVSTPAGRLMLHMVGAFAEFERAIIRDRVRAGLEFARSRGRVLGRPSATSPERIREMRLAGKSYREISAALGCSTSTVRKVIGPSVAKTAP